MMENKNSRRQFFKLALGALALTPILRVADALAEAAMPKSAKIKGKMINDKTIKRLKYVADAEEAKKDMKMCSCGNVSMWKLKRD